MQHKYIHVYLFVFAFLYKFWEMDEPISVFVFQLFTSFLWLFHYRKKKDRYDPMNLDNNFMHCETAVLSKFKV